MYFIYILTHSVELFYYCGLFVVDFIPFKVLVLNISVIILFVVELH